MSTRVTMRDVALAVGVSPMTVSRALRDDDTVRRETREQVQRAAHELGYVYDTTAQAFRTQKSGFVAVSLPSINNANFAETFRGLSDSLTEHGLQLLLGSTGYSVEKEEDLVRQLLARNPEAIVLTGGHHTEQTRKLLMDRKIPIVEMWDLPDDPIQHVVGFSNSDAMALIVRHLAQSGRRKLAFVGGSDGSDMRGYARRFGALRAAQDLDLPAPVLIDAGPAPVTMRNGADIITQWGRDIAQFDALVCVSDPVAFGCLCACRRLGLSVPDDLAITGFGNFDLAAVCDPRITTIGVTARDIGTRVAALLLDVFEHDTDTSPQTIDVATRLVRGETS